MLLPEKAHGTPGGSHVPTNTPQGIPNPAQSTDFPNVHTQVPSPPARDRASVGCKAQWFPQGPALSPETGPPKKDGASLWLSGFLGVEWTDLSGPSHRAFCASCTRVLDHFPLAQPESLLAPATCRPSRLPPDDTRVTSFVSRMVLQRRPEGIQGLVVLSGYAQGGGPTPLEATLGALVAHPPGHHRPFGRDLPCPQPVCSRRFKCWDCEVQVRHLGRMELPWEAGGPPKATMLVRGCCPPPPQPLSQQPQAGAHAMCLGWGTCTLMFAD